jgi:hypothetical protein
MPIIGAHNMSSVVCTEEMLSLLNKGLKFIPTTVVRGVDASLKRDLERYERAIRLRSQFGSKQPQLGCASFWNHAHAFRQRNPAYMPPPAGEAVEH